MGREKKEEGERFRRRGREYIVEGRDALAGGAVLDQQPPSMNHGAWVEPANGDFSPGYRDGRSERVEGIMIHEGTFSGMEQRKRVCRPRRVYRREDRSAPTGGDRRGFCLCS